MGRDATPLARRLRRDATEAEKRLWSALRQTPLPCRLRRQHPIGPYIADFALPEIRLVIELDGGQHAENASDDRRTAALAAAGWRVIRFWNHEVLGNTAGVVEAVLLEVRRCSPTSPHPSPP
ncbi:endonuclease domain-containing protein [Zavarzinia sp.]|uniref:endonuclease domain-containing protein n=1 Tax=Zavarzinia sp. TaxID=2027920 RepID=UPI003BB76846